MTSNNSLPEEQTCFDKAIPVCSNPTAPFDYAYPNRASITFPSLGNFSLNVVKFELPSLSLPDVRYYTPLVDDKIPGDKMTFTDFSCEILIASDYSDYLAIFEWIVGLSKPREFAQYKNKPHHRMDFNLNILNTFQRPILTVNFQEAFPTSLGSIGYDFAVSQPEPIQVPVTFAYTMFEILKGGESVT